MNKICNKDISLPCFCRPLRNQSRSLCLEDWKLQLIAVWMCLALAIESFLDNRTAETENPLFNHTQRNMKFTFIASTLGLRPVRVDQLIWPWTAWQHYALDAFWTSDVKLPCQCRIPYWKEFHETTWFLGETSRQLKRRKPKEQVGLRHVRRTEMKDRSKSCFLPYKFALGPVHEQGKNTPLEGLRMVHVVQNTTKQRSKCHDLHQTLPPLLVHFLENPTTAASKNTHPAATGHMQPNLHTTLSSDPRKWLCLWLSSGSFP